MTWFSKPSQTNAPSAAQAAPGGPRPLAVQLPLVDAAQACGSCASSCSSKVLGEEMTAQAKEAFGRLNALAAKACNGGGAAQLEMGPQFAQPWFEAYNHLMDLQEKLERQPNHPAGQAWADQPAEIKALVQDLIKSHDQYGLYAQMAQMNGVG